MYSIRYRYRRRPQRRLPPTKQAAAPTTKAPPLYRKRVRWEAWVKPTPWRPQQRHVLPVSSGIAAPVTNPIPLTFTARDFDLSFESRGFELNFPARGFELTYE